MPPKLEQAPRRRHQSFGIMSNRIPPKLMNHYYAKILPFGTMSNRMPPKPLSLEILTLLIPQIAVVPHKLPTMDSPLCSIAFVSGEHYFSILGYNPGNPCG